MTSTLSKNVDKIEVFLAFDAALFYKIGEPGGAGNTSPGSDHKRPLEGTHHG